MRINKETVAKSIDKFESDLRGSNKLSDRIIFDSQTIGFGLRLRRSGRHTWIIQYRTNLGQQRRETLGLVASISADKARKWAIDKYAKVKTGHDPAAEKEREREKAKHTLASVIADFLEIKKTKLRPISYAPLARYLHEQWKPLHDTPIAKIDKDSVKARLKHNIKQHGPSSAGAGRDALSGLFVWAMKQGLCSTNPVLATDDPDAHTARERVLSDDELRQVWNACEDDDYGRIIRLLILTGCRRQEIGSMSWDELNTDTGEFTIAGYRTKNGRPHQMILPADAWAIIKQVPRRHGIPFLFGKDHGFVSWSRNREQFDRRCNIKPWVVHDLRRTAASGMQRLGLRVEVIEKALNHVSGVYRGVAGIYQRDPMTEQVREALEKWSAYVRRVVTTGEERKIVPMKPIPA